MLGRDDPDYGYDEWPSDRITPVSRVLTTEPFEIFGEKVTAANDRLKGICEEENAVRASVLDLKKQEKEWLASVSKYPQLATALDFLEGRITHVVIDQYGEISVKTLQEALTYYDEGWGRKTEKGLKLLSLFGHEKGKPSRWAINHYSDGSGHYTTVDPLTSEEATWDVRIPEAHLVAPVRDDVINLCCLCVFTSCRGQAATHLTDRAVSGDDPDTEALPSLGLIPCVRRLTAWKARHPATPHFR